MPRQIFHLLVTLSDIAPPVWRRVQVPGGYTLDRVHRVIQHAMGWRDCHLHSFEINGAQYGEPDPAGELLLRDELDTRLDAVATKGARFRYTYDFGDWWEHDVVVEDVTAPEPDVRYPLCADGDQACPPEDVGGAFGYTEFRAAIADPAHPRHAEMADWVSATFDRFGFDPARVTTLLRRLT
ncbi:pRiA4b ORF-3-like protein [Micromonospora sp. Llam0]|uniref:plasmid pRiA4b ORF-3 family protein n=1 Tax=Micromonospora sp. Llam0 TaxID=2485143 RepID=UPI000F4A4C61|nr:plasmid pRiA4b ORF-3 family protein [Micromonospora sp. Llam0]ROO59012.1 pRiA4b ORF-3-like protein [Micromonospora sp. Llam0]